MVKEMTTTKEDLMRSLYDFLTDEDDTPAMSFRAFRTEWENHGMIVAIFNIGWLQGSNQ